MKPQQPDSYYINRILQEKKINDFSYLVDRYQDMVYTLSFKLVQDSQLANDISQEAFIKAYKNLKSFNGSSKFSTWLYTISYREGINQLRKFKTVSIDTQLNTEPYVEEKDLPLEQYTAQERSIYLEKAISHLKEIDRLIISLFYLAQKSIEEIEEITDISKSNIKVRLHRSRKQLEEILSKLLPYEERSII
ncbi:MAG: RNA polymerase sigma factor [Flavobacteriaceae bacterium]